MAEIPIITNRDFGDKDLNSSDFANFLSSIGVIDPSSKLVLVTPTTARHNLPGKDYGNGWHRGGSESFIQVLDALTDDGSVKSVLRKAHHSMGGEQVMTSKAQFEAVLLNRLADIGHAPRVRAVLGPVIYRDLVVPDSQQPIDSNEQRNHLHRLLEDMGYKPITGTQLEVMFENGVIKLIDGGPGDISRIR